MHFHAFIKVLHAAAYDCIMFCSTITYLHIPLLFRLFPNLFIVNNL